MVFHACHFYVDMDKKSDLYHKAPQLLHMMTFVCLLKVNIIFCMTKTQNEDEKEKRTSVSKKEIENHLYY